MLCRGSVYYAGLMRYLRTLCHIENSSGRNLEHNQQTLTSTLLMMITATPELVPLTDEDAVSLLYIYLHTVGNIVIAILLCSGV